MSTDIQIFFYKVKCCSYLIVLLFFVSCRDNTSINPSITPVAHSQTQNKYCLYLNKGQDYIYFQNYKKNKLEKALDVEDSTFYGYVNGGPHMGEKAWSINSIDSISMKVERFIDRKKVFIQNSKSGQDMFFPSKEKLQCNYLNDTILSFYALGKADFNRLFIHTEDSLKVILHDLNFNELNMTGKKGLSIQLTGSEQKCGIVTISHSIIKYIHNDIRINNMYFTDCLVTGMPIIKGENAPDTLTLEKINFSENSRLFINDLGKEEGFIKKTILVVNDVDMSHVSLDYSKFELIQRAAVAQDDENIIYNLNKKAYDDIIQSQEIDHNERGKIKAIVELNEFEDAQKFGGRYIILLKTWWNNYGYKKEKIILNSLIILLLFSSLNFLFFKKLRKTYKIQSIETALQSANGRSRKVIFYFKNILLCITYTAYIYFGLKLNIEKLNLLNYRMSLWIIIQYIVGLIVLGYIANLIITE